MTGSHHFYSFFVVLTALLLASCAPTESDSPEVQLATVNATSAIEGDSGQSNITFRVSSDIEQRIRYQTFNITAASNSDYISQSGEWLMQPGATRILDVPVLGDTQVEADELVGLLLTYSDDSQSRHQATIINDDRPDVSIASQRTSEGSEDTTTMRFTLSLSQTTLTDFPLRIVTEDTDQALITDRVGPSFAPATASVDYQPIDLELNIPPGANEASVEVLIIGDTDIESDEAFHISVFDDSEYSPTEPALDSAFGLITNDDGPGFNMPEVTLDNAQTSEGAAGDTNSLSFPVVLNGPNEVDFSIHYQVVFPSTSSNGLPPADSNDLPESSGTFMDIDATGGSISINDSIPIPLTGDNTYELDEYFELVLTTDSGFELTRARGVIQNDDFPQFTLADVSKKEGASGKSNMTFTLVWDEPEPVAEEIRVKYRTLDGFSVDDSKATSGVDYDYTSGTATFLPGDSEKTINVPIVGDTRYEPNEALTLQASTESGESVASARGLIVNDDDPELEVTPTDGTNVNEAAGAINFEAIFSDIVTQDTTLYYVISSGSATAGVTGEPNADVTSSSLTGTAFYRENEDTSTDMPISVTVVDDLLVEETESFSITFYSSQQDADNDRNALFQSTTSITDNDVIQIEFSTSAFSGKEGNTDGAELTLGEMQSAQTKPTLTISNGILPEDASVTMSLQDPGTAETDDYRFIGSDPVTISIPADNYSTPKSMDITDFVVVSDLVLENDESLTLALNIDDPELPIVIGSRDTLTVTIENDDKLELGFSSTADISGSEDNPAELPGLQAFSAVADDYDPTNPGGEPLEVTLTLLNPGDANQAELDDFSPTLPANLTITDFPIAVDDVLTNVTMPTVLDDDLVELDENASLRLTADTNGLTSINSTRETVNYNIISDDQIQLTLDTSSIAANEGSLADIPITIEGGILDSDSPTLVFEMTVTADAGTESDDFTLSTGTVTVPESQDYTSPTVKTDWLDNALELVSDGIVEGTETLTIGLGPISEQLSSVLAYTSESATATLSILDNDTLEVEFTKPNFESYENERVTEPAVVVNGTTEIDVLLEFQATGNTDYPANINSDISIDDITVRPSHITGDIYPFPDIVDDDADTEFNEGLTMRIKTGSETGEPITLLSQDEATWLILNDDLLPLINGSGIDYCADDTALIDSEVNCDDITADDLKTQDAKLTIDPISATPPPKSGDDGADTPLSWTCITDSSTQLVWAFEDTSTPEKYTDSEVATKIGQLDGVCEINDWRRPTYRELVNLMTFTGETGLLDTSIFTQVQITDSSDRYWFRESDSGSNSQLLSFNQGEVTADTGGAEYLMLVSDTNAPLIELRPTEVYACATDQSTLDSSIQSDHRFTVSGNEITDNLTGLTWVARSLLTDSTSWGAALAQAENHDGSSGWRAPTIKELLSLVTLNCDDNMGLLLNTRLPEFFLPRLDETNDVLPLMSSSPVDSASEATIWTLDLNIESELLKRSEPTVPMQTFVVKAP